MAKISSRASGSGTSVTFTEKGAWATSTAYVVGDIVTQNLLRYICSAAHTSGTFATDLAAPKWVLVTAGFAGCRLSSSGAQSISNNSATILSWDTEAYDVGNLHEGVTHPSRITIPTAGKYRVFANLEWAANASGGRSVTLKVNGTTYIASQLYGAAPSPFGTDQSLGTDYSFAAGDYVEVEVYQNSGGALNVNAAFSAFGATFLGS